MHKNQSKHIKTSEDWYPTLQALQKSPNPGSQFNNPLDHPAVWVGLLELSDGQWRVCVWGADDFGMEKDHESYPEALDLFELIDNFTTQKELEDLGFINA